MKSVCTVYALVFLRGFYLIIEINPFYMMYKNDEVNGLVVDSHRSLKLSNSRFGLYLVAFKYYNFIFFELVTVFQ